jgi:hypothetical protein
MSITETIKTVLYGPPGLQRMCIHPAEAHIPSWDAVPDPRAARQCGVCKGQCA